tara:strand:+ start:5683 stop:6840 length:1158 start_codon:yes stop_codon:yes gene_type:complete
MDTFVAHPHNLDFNNGSFYKSLDNYKKANNFKDFKDFESLSHKDKLIYLLPSSIIGSYPFQKNKKLSAQNNMANFMSEIDAFIVNDVSENEFFIFDDVGFVINKGLYKTLNASLNKLKCKIILVPDYFLNKKTDTNTITEFNNRFLFSFDDGTGASTDLDSLKQYLAMVESRYINFEPNVYSSKPIKELDGYNQNENISIANFVQEIKDDLPSIFKFEFSMQNIFNKLNFSKIELYACILLLASSISLPYVLNAQNNKQINMYETEIFNIFKMIDKNTKRVVTPKVQIDQLIEQIPGSSKMQPSRDESKFDNFSFMISLGEKYIDAIEIDFTSNQATLDLLKLPQIQYAVIKNTVDTFDINIIDEDIINENKEISGQIKIELNNE